MVLQFIQSNKATIMSPHLHHDLKHCPSFRIYSLRAKPKECSSAFSLQQSVSDLVDNIKSVHHLETCDIAPPSFRASSQLSVLVEGDETDPPNMCHLLVFFIVVALGYSRRYALTLRLDLFDLANRPLGQQQHLGDPNVS